jgi:hypothetical protein
MIKASCTEFQQNLYNVFVRHVEKVHLSICWENIYISDKVCKIECTILNLKYVTRTFTQGTSHTIQSMNDD